MLISIKSENADLGYVIRKNPASGYKGMQQRKGVSVGFFNGPQQYIMRFFEGADTNSYPDKNAGDFAYAVQSVAALAALNLLWSYVKDAAVKPEERDTPTHQEIEIVALRVESDKIVETFQHYFPEFVLTAVPYEHWNKNVRIKIEHEGTLSDLLCFVNTFLLLVAISNGGEYIETAPTVIEKYLSMALRLDPPYFVRYLLKTALLHDRGQFNKFKTRLEASEKYDIQLVYGNTQQARQDWVRNYVKSNIVLDVGCGEASYRRVLKNVSEYYGVDPDDDVLHIARRKNPDDTFYNKLEDVPEIGKCDILLIEVIEHIAANELPGFINDVLSRFDWEKVMITSPNKDFNQHYALENGVRREDHINEMTTSEFWHFFSEYNQIYDVHFFDVCDKVDGRPVTQGVVIERKK